MWKCASVNSSFSRVELPPPEGDSLQRILNANVIDYKCLPSLRPTRTGSRPRGKGFVSANASPKSTQKTHEARAVSRDISFLEAEKPDESRVGTATDQRKVLISADVFDHTRLEEFSRAMLDPSVTAKYSLLPAHGFGKPTSRRDVELLGEWLTQQEQSLLKLPSASELFQQAQLVYGQCLRELTRQVAVQCAERGQLLDKTLRAYVFLFEKVLRAYRKDIEKREFNTRAKITKLHEIYLGKLEQLRKKTYDQTEEIRKLKEEHENAEFAIQSYQSKETHYKERIRIIQQHYEDTKRKFQTLEALAREAQLKSEGKAAPVIQFLSLNQQSKRDPFLDKELAEDMDELGEQQNKSLTFARKLFKNQILKYIHVDNASGSSIRILNSKSTQTKLIHFPLPPVQAESSVPLPVAQVTHKRVSMIWRAQTLQESGFSLEKLSESLKDIDLILLGEDVDTMEFQKQLKHANLRTMLEQCVDFTAAGILHRDYLSTQMKKLKVDLQEKDKLAKMAERRFRDLDQENLRLSNVIETLEMELSRLRRENEQLRKDFVPPPEVKPKQPENEEVKQPQKSLTLFKEFHLGRKKILYKRSSNLPSTILVEKFSSEKVKSKATMTVKTLLKQLTAIFNDYKQQGRDNQFTRNQEFSHYCYEWLMTKHGLRRVTEQKFTHLLAASEFFKDNKKACIFARFLGLFDALNNEDLKFFAHLTDVMTKWGLAVDTFEIDDPLMGTSVLQSVITEVLLSKFPDLDVSKLRTEIESLNSRAGFVSQYDFITYSLKKFRSLLVLNKNYVDDLFKAADLNGDGYLEFEEFEVLCRHIVKEKKRLVGIARIFESSADLMLKLDEGDEPKPVISLEKFSALSIEYDLFGVEAQHAFMGVKAEEDILEGFVQLREQSLKLFLDLEARLQRTGDDHTTLMHSMSLLESKLSTEGMERSLFMAYKLLEAETNMKYVEWYMKSFQPKIFKAMDAVFSEFFDSED